MVRGIRVRVGDCYKAYLGQHMTFWYLSHYAISDYTDTQWGYRSKLCLSLHHFNNLCMPAVKSHLCMHWVQKSVYNFLIGPRADIKFYLKGFDFDKLLNTFRFEGRLKIHVHSKKQ